MKILGISGSLRARSYNTALIDAARELAPDGVTVERFDLAGVPLYNGDLDNEADRPPAVIALKEAIAAADGVLLATPEYNHGIPGVLKNALDWASRPAYRSPFAGKPVAIVSAAPGIIGGARAQAHLKVVLLGMASEVYPHPEFVMGRARERVDEELRLTDAKSRELLGGLLEGFAGWISRR